MNNTFFKSAQSIWTKQPYKSMSLLAKNIYMFLVDRQSYSLSSVAKGDKSWIDKDGGIFCIMTNTELVGIFELSEKTIINAKKELVEVGLLKQVKGGFNKPMKLYVTDLLAEPATESLTEPLTVNSPVYQDLPSNTNIDTNTDTIKLPEPQSVEITEQPVKASEVFNNGVNNLWFENKALNTMQRMVNGSLAGVHDLISTILNAKKKVEKTVKQSLWLDYNDEQTTVVIESIDRLFKAGQVKDLYAYVYNSFRNMIENRLNTQMQHATLWFKRCYL